MKQTNVDDLLDAPVSLYEAKDTAPLPPALSKESFTLLEQQVKALKLRIEQGETITREESRQITVWFREVRSKSFTLAKQNQKKPKLPKKRKPTEEEKQKLSEALINAL